MSVSRCHLLAGHSSVDAVPPGGKEIGRTAKSTLKKIKDMVLGTGNNPTHVQPSPEMVEKKSERTANGRKTEAKATHPDSQSEDRLAYYDDRKTQALRWRGYF